ncbi:MAG TPA: 2-oxoglutarate dehydrogenase complex dihydrolipoyllysine-residue succinyltransferase [Planctomycetota bacterium]|nr:2-oxoglutarate dehydrogenase complex dihydrolipoyllysine-residue succinyltransferase [Planctomycetota bacterium]
MPSELKVPQVGESITEVQIGDWLKKPGEKVERDQPVVAIESDKATVEIPAPISGFVTRMLKKKGDTAQVGEVIGYVDENGAGAAPAAASAAALPPPPPTASTAAAAAVPPPSAGAESPRAHVTRIMPAAQRALDEAGLNAKEVEPTGPGGRMLKEDVLREAERKKEKEKPVGAPSHPSTKPISTPADAARTDEFVKMSPMRKRIAENLVRANSTMALLTTFNEIDMSAVMELRNRYKEAFQKKYGAKLGFMSFFVKAAVEALRAIPQVNAEIRGDEIVYHSYNDIGIAVGGGKGLVVPILRNAERMSFATIETTIADFGARAQANRITLDELTGGTFTISNGGVYGSLLSTPIVNPPQSGILGLHAIQERPVAKDGQVVIRPMMYVALTYDHRIVDGREAVTFLKTIKECVEDPARLLLEV